MTILPSLADLAGLPGSCGPLLATGSRWLPPRASSAAAGVDFVFALIFWISAFFLILVVGLTIAFVVKYRARRWSAVQESPGHSTALELAWTIIPTILILVIFGSSTSAYLKLTEPPEGADLQEIRVTARKWSWVFDYPDGTNLNDLHVIVDQPVVLTMGSEDVLHSFYVPAFRLKQDVVPGRYVKTWFTATEPGTYPLYCAEYCGENHSMMVTNVVVHKDHASYEKGRDLDAQFQGMPLLEVGEHVHLKRGCVACHSLDGTRGVGPSFTGLWGRTESLSAGGTSVIVDENYIRESIIDPHEKIVAGFQPVMPPTVMSEREVLGAIELIKSLKD
jgi:cytochrome c oxidase subunit 2